jgi:hypothetical protein
LLPLEKLPPETRVPLPIAAKCLQTTPEELFVWLSANGSSLFIETEVNESSGGRLRFQVDCNDNNYRETCLTSRLAMHGEAEWIQEEYWDYEGEYVPPKVFTVRLSGVNAFAKDILTFTGRCPQVPTVVALTFMDPEHQFYSEELALAVKAWMELYSDGGKYQRNQAHKKQIVAMLKGKGLSGAAVERIATLVNPGKRGGAPASGF